MDENETTDNFREELSRIINESVDKEITEQYNQAVRISNGLVIGSLIWTGVTIGFATYGLIKAFED